MNIFSTKFSISINYLYEMLYTIWYHLYNLKNVKSTHGGVLLLVKLQKLKVTFLHGCFSRFLFKLLRPATLLMKRLWHRCFPVNFAKFLRTALFIEYLWWLLLHTQQKVKNEYCLLFTFNFLIILLDTVPCVHLC